MDNLESSQQIVDRLLDPKCERTDKYIAREVKEAYIIYVLEKNWRRICGDNLAKNCCLHKIENNTLTIRTASSVWANHLLMMKNLFLQKINSFLLGKVIIRDLKFYSGGVIKQYEARQLQKQEPEEKPVYNKCIKCGLIIKSEDNLCTVCKREEREILSSKIAELLKIQPWINYEDCLNYYKCDKILFTAVKDRVKNTYFEKVRLGYAAKNDRLLAVMFLTGRKPEEIDENIYNNSLEYLRRDQSVPASRVGLYGKKQRYYSNF